MMATLEGGWACRFFGGGGASAVCGSERKCLLYERLVGGAFPRAASLYVAAALKLLIINGPKGPKLILYSHKALMQGKVGANGTLGTANQRRRRRGSQMQMQ